MKKRKNLSKKKLSTIFNCICAGIVFTITPDVVNATSTYTWVGGLEDNSMGTHLNWDPTDGPPGPNDEMLFSTATNPPFLFDINTGADMHVDFAVFTVPDVVCTIQGFLEIDSGVQNQNGVLSTFNIQEGGALIIGGGSLADGGVTIYNADASSLTVRTSDISNASVNLSNGSLFTIEDTLSMGALSSSSSLDSIVLSSELLVGNDDNQTITGVISSTGSFTKKGKGTLSLNGINTLTGTTFVNEGRLSVNEVVRGDVYVRSGATLGGVGSIGGSLFVDGGGILSPGNSIGSLFLASLSLDPASTTNIEIDPSSSSEIIVAGNASLGGIVNVVQDSGSYQRTGSYQILNAGTLSGSFSGVSGGLPGFVFSLSSSAHDVFLNYIFNIPTKGFSGNILRTADYLNRVSSVSAGFVSLASLSGDTLEDALKTVSPARNAFPVFASQQMGFSLSKMVSHHLFDKRLFESADISCCNTLCDSFTLWAGGFFERSDVASENQNPEYKFNSEAGMIGCDYKINPDILVGAGAGYGYTSLSESGDKGSASVDYYFGTLYSNADFDCFYVESALWGIFHQAHNKRHIYFPGFDAYAKGNFNGWQCVPHIGFGIKAPFSWVVVEPFIAFDWVVNWEDDLDEHGTDSFDIQQKALTTSLLQSQAGVRFYNEFFCSWGIFGAKEEVSYLNRTLFGSGKVKAALIGSRDYFSLDAFSKTQNLVGLNIELFVRPECLSGCVLSLDYDGEFGSELESNLAILKISFDF